MLVPKPSVSPPDMSNLSIKSDQGRVFLKYFAQIWMAYWAIEKKNKTKQNSSVWCGKGNSVCGAMVRTSTRIKSEGWSYC